jgi:hypothetical protein
LTVGAARSALAEALTVAILPVGASPTAHLANRIRTALLAFAIWLTIKANTMAASVLANGIYRFGLAAGVEPPDIAALAISVGMWLAVAFPAFASRTIDTRTTRATASVVATFPI